MKINLISLGCSKNTVDSEVLAGNLTKEGFEVEYSSPFPNYDVALINTCGFINDAKEESINTILLQCSLKELGKIQQVIVFGCLAQRFMQELKEELTLVDAFFGVADQDKIIKYLKASSEPYTLKTRLVSTPVHYAYLKISEGCDRRCSYCAIPLIRGNQISIPIEDLIAEAKTLVDRGKRELILIAQDTTAYGTDIYHKKALADLLRKLIEIDDLHWIRIQYAYPQDFPMEVIDLMTQSPKICSYIDIPLQHISNKLLSSMKRNITAEQTKELVNQIRNKVPDVAFRTTFIVGYPGETIEDFAELKDFVSQMRFERMGCFTYSAEEGTAAYELEDNVPQEEKERRQDELMSLQEKISLELNEKKIGQTFEVVIDRRESDFYIARTQYDSPEVDNEVLIPDKEKVEIGKFYQIEIVDAVEFDLIGKVVKQ